MTYLDNEEEMLDLTDPFDLLIDSLDDYEEYPLEDTDDLTESSICSACSGSGEGQYDGSICPTCHGNGEIKLTTDNEDYDY